MADTSISYELLLDQLQDGVCFADTQNRITYWNMGAARITGCEREAMLGQNAGKTLVHLDGEGRAAFEAPGVHAWAREHNETVQRELFLKNSSGALIPVLIRVSTIKNGRGEVIGTLEVFSDNSDKLGERQRIEELEEIALICPTTEVGNRRYAEMTLRNAFEELRRYGWDFGILFIDIDHFKKVNDTYGHVVGDDVLRMVAHSLRNTLRAFDFVGRWGGEEFIVVLPNINGEVLAMVAERCRLHVEECVYQTEGRELSVSISVGAVLADPGEDLEALIKRADALMYRSKSEGRNRVTMDEE